MKEGLRQREESAAAKQATVDAQTDQLAAKDQEIQRLTKWAQRAAQDTREEKEKLMNEGLRKEEKINAMLGVTRELQEQLGCLKQQLDQRQADLDRADIEQWLLLREFCGKSQPGQIGASEACDSDKQDAPPDLHDGRSKCREPKEETAEGSSRAASPSDTSLDMQSRTAAAALLLLAQTDTKQREESDQRTSTEEPRWQLEVPTRQVQRHRGAKEAAVKQLG